jgi:hypothetical protein
MLQRLRSDCMLQCSSIGVITVVQRVDTVQLLQR